MMEPPPADSPKTVTRFGSPPIERRMTSQQCCRHEWRINIIRTKLGDVLLYPFQRKSLVVQTSVSGGVLLEGWARQPSESTEAVVQADVL